MEVRRLSKACLSTPASKFQAFRYGTAQRLVGVLIAAILAVFFVTPAAAFKLFGHSFFEPAESAAAPDAQTYSIAVNVANPDKNLADSVREASLLYAGKDGTPPPSTAAFLSRARAEYQRVLAVLYADGFYGGSISITVDGRPLEDINADASLPHPVPVVIDVNPGPAFVFGSVTIAGRAPAATPGNDPKIKTPEELGLVSGQPARSDIVVQSEQALVDAWRRLGYPKAAALPRVVIANHETNRLNVTIGVDPGRAAVYGAISVTGTRDVNPDFVARETGLRPGERYDPADLERATRRLRDLLVFSSTRIVEDPTIAADGSLGLTANVAERPPHVFGGGASYSTIDGAGVDGYWEDRNLFGEAERLRIDGRVSGIDSSDPRNYTYATGVTFVKPGVLSPMTDLTVQVLGSREVYDPYTQKTLRARIGLAEQFSDQLNGSVSVNAERDIVDDAFGHRDLFLASLPMSLVYDTTDNKLEPTRGYRAKLAVEPFYEFNYGNAGVFTRLDGSTYFSFDQDGRFVLAGRVALGSIVGAPTDELPDDRLFFAGGGGSVRGYSYRSLGPRLADGAVVGGRSLAEASVEMRVKVTDTIGVVPFVDAGEAFAQSYPSFSDTIKIGAGVGLRYYTGIGAIRVDFARAVNWQRGDPKFALYIGLGESF